MNDMNEPVSIGTLAYWEAALNDWVFLAAMVLLGLEFVRYALQRRLSWKLAGDTVTNFLTTTAFLLITFLIGAAYVGAFYIVWESFSLWQLPINGWTILGCLILADFAYYWEHRFLHRVGIAWASHTVHHSSPHFNLSVAYRFGPLDWLWPMPFHLPLAVLGFHPALILFSEVMVQLYQTALHTEAVRKLPKPIEKVMNTPSHHRVHHGSNPEYLDRNYGGIFIIWDRLFGTFAEEKAPVRFGLVNPIGTVNPLRVFLHGFTRLGRKLWQAGSTGERLRYLGAPPDWSPEPGKTSIR